MGLEMVEIVMEVEKTFGISLSDYRASKISTVGDLFACVVETLGYENEGDGLKDEIIKELQDALHSVASERARREMITVDLELAKLFPVFGRRKAWRRLAIILYLKLPSLECPHLISTVFLVIAIVLGNISGILMLQSVFPPRTNLPGWLIGVLGVLFVLLSVFLWCLVSRFLTLPSAILWPTDIRTIGDLSRYILKKRYGEFFKNSKRFNRDEAWCIMQDIVASTLRINPSDVKLESRFYEDLGA